MIHQLGGFFSRFPWVLYVVKIVLLVVVALLLWRFVLAGLRRWARRKQAALIDGLVALVDQALVPFLGLAVVAASINLFPLSAKLLAVINRIVYLGVLAVGLYYSTRTAGLLLNHWITRAEGRLTLREPLWFFTRLIFAVLGIMLVLENLGVSLTAAWTTLGVGGVAVALALQDTLSNFFAGVYIRLDSPVRVGDYIRMDTGDKGVVSKLGWRSTRIQTEENNIIVVPNSKIASAIVTNYNRPEAQLSLPLRVRVSYNCDPEHVERVLVDEASRAVGQVEGLLAEPRPYVRLIPGFRESSLDFTLFCRVMSTSDAEELVQHELRKRILVRFRREGIEIPFPQRDVHFQTHSPMALSAAPR